MSIISVDSIRGDELLARDIISSNGFLLIPAGTKVKRDYVDRLKKLDIEYLYVNDDLAREVSLQESLEIQIMDQFQGTLRDILHNYTYHNDIELVEIKKVADDIIADVMKDSNVIYNISSIRSKSDCIYSHSLNVCALSIILAIKLKLSKSKIRDIAIGCLLHDIGMLYLNVDYSGIKLETCSKEERKEIKKHIIYGYSAIEKMEWLSPTAKDIIISHHERLDGMGYPFHLKGNKIKIGSRIAAVCDEFDSRVYGIMSNKMKVHDVIDYIVSQADVKYDYNVVNVFVESVAAYPTGTIVITNEREMGIVLRQNPKCPTRPVIRIIRDNNGRNPEDWIVKDLTKELTLFIVDSILE